MRSWLWQFSLTLATLTATAFGPAPALAQCNRVVISANPDNPPYHWAERGRIVGASVVLIGRILDQLGVAWETRDMGPMPRLLKAAERGEVDLLLGLKRTTEREVYLAYTRAAAFSNPVAVFVANARPLKFEQPQDLISKSGGRTAGESFGDAFDRLADQSLTMQEADSLGVNFLKLAAGRIDYVVAGLHTGRAQLQKLGLADRIMALPKLINDGVSYHGFSRHSACTVLLDAVNAGLAAAHRDGQEHRLLEDSLKQWLKPSPPGRLP